MVHSGLETLYRHRQLGIELEAVDLSNRLAESWEQAAVEEEMKFECSAAEQTLRQQAVDLITAYVQQVPTVEPKPLAVEVALGLRDV